MKPKLNTFRAFLCVSLCSFCLLSTKCGTNSVSPIGNQSYETTKSILDYGKRISGTEGIKKVQNYIQSRVEKMGYSLEKQSFQATTPKGEIEMVNLIYTIPTTSVSKNSKVLLSAHYDSKNIEGITFLGANDAASSVALILELSRSIEALKLSFDVEVVFFDGEEAFHEWTKVDSLYGSRNYVSRSENLKDLEAMILLDMISDKSLQLIRSRLGDAKWMSILEESLSTLSYSNLLDKKVMSVEDDHVPFVEAGVPVLHLMDFTYGSSYPPGRFWHTKDDTLKNISKESLSKVGEIVLECLKNYNTQKNTL